ncbi:HAD family hydrolase [Vibrio furnissii]|uniref:HAD family hydrolase n=1 Tax=Vibrio furnissii TaxID=29494 RepID=UPI0013026C20|nr:HAD family hydrolase [Vibrio furnissii]
MTSIYLFDWGDTLMVNMPSYQGKMCDWPSVEAMPQALETLRMLSQHAQVYVATNADDSTEADIQQAFARVGLDDFIQGYFCKQTLGFAKGTPEFFATILHHLNVRADAITMVGDTLEKDILPALDAGIQAVWYNPSHQMASKPYSGSVIHSLAELIEE